MLAVAAALRELRRWGRFEVRGESMAPVLQPGAWVAARSGGRIRPGHVVLARDPRDRSRILVKRVLARTRAGFELRGDNAAASTDSRDFGPVPPGAVLGRVVVRYWPRPALVRARRQR